MNDETEFTSVDKLDELQELLCEIKYEIYSACFLIPIRETNRE